MMMTWISDKAVKWILYILAPLIVIGLLFMGMTGLTTQKESSVGIVNGVKLNNAEFRNYLQSSDRQNTQRGVRLTDQQRSQARQRLFDQMVVSQLLKEKFDENDLRASVFEMKKELMENPNPQFKSFPQFQTDSVFDINKYQAWLQNDTVYDLQGMDNLEADLRDNQVPMNQLQLFVSAKQHVSDLERAFDIRSRENKLDIEYVSVSLDSFGVLDKNVTEDDIAQYFGAHTDSFYVEQDYVQFNYVSVQVVPSTYDENNAQLHTEWISGQIKAGSSDFAQMAKTNSEDLASAPQGGALGDYSSRDQWVKPFADAAFALQEGEISAPVKTEYGYHLIQSHGKKMVDGIEKAKLSHILVKVTPGPETVDSLRLLLEDVRTQVLAGADFKTSVEGNKLTVNTSGFITRGDSIGTLGYLVGLSDFGFVDRDNKEKVSRVLQNGNTMALFESSEKVPMGTRSLEIFADDIKNLIVSEKKAAKAKEYLSQKLVTLTSGTVDSSTVEAIAKLSFDKASKVSSTGFVPKISYGYGSTTISNIAGQKVNEWGAPLVGMGYVIAAKVVSKIEISESDIAEKIMIEKKAPMNQYTAQNVFNTWAMNLKSMADIENNLDLFYAE